MYDMPFINELIISVVGGVLTAIVLGLFSGRRKPKQAVYREVQEEAQIVHKGPSTIGQFFHLLIAVIGGIALSSMVSRFLFKAGILERGLPMRIVVLISCVVLVWWVLLLFRGRK